MKKLLIFGFVFLLLISFISAKQVITEDTDFKMTFYPETIICNEEFGEYRCHYNIILEDKKDNNACFELKDVQLINNRINNKLKKDKTCNQETQSYFVVPEFTTGKFDVEFKYKGKTYFIDPYWITNSSNFNGTFYQTYVNLGCIELNLSYEYGYYLSQIFDAGTDSNYFNISWERSEYPSFLDFEDRIIYYKFDNDISNGESYSYLNTDEFIYDYAGDDNDGNANTDIEFNSLIGIESSGAFIYDRADDYINVTNQTNIANIFQNGGSISVWVYPYDDGEDSNGRIADKGNNLGWSFFVTGSNDNPKVSFNRWFSVDEGKWETTNVLNITQYHHIVLVYNSSSINNNPLIYINGINTTFTETKDPVGTPLDDTIHNMYIGNREALSSTFWGRIDEFMLFNRSLNQSDVSNLYATGLLELNLSVRGCDDAVCSGESWNDLPDASPQNFSILGERYFQYRFNFKSENLGYSPVLCNTSVYYETVQTEPIASEFIQDQRINTYNGDECLYLQWNVTDADGDNLTYDTDNPIINISQTGLITGCYDNSSLGNYTINVNVTDEDTNTLTDEFNLEVYYHIEEINIIDFYGTTGLNNATIYFEFDHEGNYTLTINNMTYTDNYIYQDEVYIFPLTADTIFQVDLIVENFHSGLLDTDTIFIKTLSNEDIQNQQSERNYQTLVCFGIIIFFVIIYIVGEVFFPPIAFLAGLAVMIYAFIAPCFVLWWMKFLIIFVGLFMILRGVSSFLFGDR